MKSRLFKTRVLWNVGPRLMTRAPGARREMVERLTKLTRNRMPARLDARLDAVDRPRAHLLRAGDLHHLVRLAQADKAGGALRAGLVSARWIGDELEVVTRIRLVTSDGEPLLLRRHGDRIRRVITPELEAALPAELLDVTDDIPAVVGEMSVRGRKSYAEWAVPSTAEVSLVDVPGGVAIEAVVTGRIHPEKAVCGRRLDTEVWGVTARLSALGHVRSTRIVSTDFAPTAVRFGRRAAKAYSTVADNLALDLGDPARIAKSIGVGEADLPDVASRV